MASLNIGAMKSEHKGPSAAPIKIEGGQGTAKSISQPTSRPIMEGSGQKEKADGGSHIFPLLVLKDLFL